MIEPTADPTTPVDTAQQLHDARNRETVARCQLGIVALELELREDATLEEILAAIRGRETELEALTAAMDADRAETMATYETMRAEIEALRCGHLAHCVECQRDGVGHAQLDAVPSQMAAPREPRSP